MRHLLTPNALKTQNLYRSKNDDDDEFYDDGPFQRMATADVVYEEDRAPALQPLGLLDSHGTPLVKYVIPIIRPIGFGRIHADDDGAEFITYITTEAEIAVEQTDAGRSDEPEYEDPDLQE